MLKKDILDLIESFEIETFKYNDNENLDNDMQYIYSIEKEVKNANDSELQLIYKKIISTIGIIRFKYGFESEIIKINPNFKELQTTLSNISLNSNNIINAIINVFLFNPLFISCINILIPFFNQIIEL